MYGQFTLTFSPILIGYLVIFLIVYFQIID